MKKILYIIQEYPQLSQTYIQVEMNTLLKNGYDIRVIALKKANHAASQHLPYDIISDVKEIINYAKQYKPDIIHTHWVYTHLPLIFKVAKTLQIPYTIRSHSFDVLKRERSLKKRIKTYLKKMRYRYIINHPLCKGVLAFPFAKKILIRSGISANKIVESPPVVDFERFYDRSKNGTDIINVGAGFAKKNFTAYMHLAKKMDKLSFNLYSIGYKSADILEKNKELGMPITMREAVEFADMPPIYKKSGWLVYTADAKTATVGWPLAALEAMASGTGVCLPNIRPDIKDYIGDAGIVYSNISELEDIIDKPVPNTMREKGFELAEKYDIKKQIHLLTDLW